MNQLVKIENSVITLKCLLDVINADRVAKGENPLIHAKQMSKVDELTKEPSFGTVAKMEVVYNNKGQKMDTYSFTKKQAIAVSARIDNSRLMYVIDKLEELSQPKQLTPKELAYMVIEAEEAKEKALLAQKKAENNVAILTHTNKTYTATEVAKELGFKSAVAFNKELNKRGYVFKQNNTWVLYSRYAELGYQQIKQEVLDNGKIVYYARWTGIGRDFLLSEFKK